MAKIHLRLQNQMMLSCAVEARDDGMEKLQVGRLALLVHYCSQSSAILSHHHDFLCVFLLHKNCFPYIFLNVDPFLTKKKHTCT